MKIDKIKSFLKSKKGKRILMYAGIGIVVLTAIIVAAVIMDASVVKLINSNPEAGSLIGGGRISSGSQTTVRAQANPGYKFLNWTNADGSEASTEEAYRLTVPESNISLTANWQIVQYNIVLHLGSDTNTTAFPTTVNIKDETIFLNDPTKEGYTFLGWYKDPEFKEAANDYIETGVTEDIVLYAKWGFSYVIEYDLGDPAVSNSPENPSTYTEEKDVVLENPVWYEIKDGVLTGGSYYFDGWYDNNANRVEKIDKNTKANITLHARWNLTKGAIYYSIYTRENVTYVDFGRYPQHILDNPRTVAELKAKIASGELTADPLTGYYTYKNTLYAKTINAPFQNEAENYRGFFSNDEEIKADEECFFIVAPIKWRVLSGNPNSTDEVLLLSENVISAGLFRENKTVRSSGGKPIYASNWEHSDIRAFLNGAFLNGAFMATEKNLFIQNTTVDFSVKTVNQTKNHKRYANGDTCVDKAFLLSYADLHNANYGWSSKTKEDALKRSKATDYAKALGAYANPKLEKEGDDNNGYEYDAAHWWLRSSGDYEGRAEIISSRGTACTYSVESKYIGIRPAITVKLK